MVTTAASTVTPTQQTMTPIVKLRLLLIPTSSDTMRTLLFLPRQMLRYYLHLIVVGAVVAILTLDVTQLPPQFVQQPTVCRYGIEKEDSDHGNAFGVVAQYETDLHTDCMCASGPHFYRDEYTAGKYCNVTPYSTGYKQIKSESIGNASMR
jgi:hypothetical protein